MDNSVALTINSEPGWHRTWRRFASNRLALASVIFLLLLHALVGIGPLLVPHSPETTNPRNSFMGPSAEHWLGTDELGRDELSRLLHGGRVTLAVGMFSMVVAVVVGTAIGALAGYLGDVVDTLLMRFTDAMMAIPAFFLVLAAVTLLGSSPVFLVLIIGLTSWMQVARVVYGEVLKWRDSEFVQAARAVGVGGTRILVRHILPQCVPSIIVSATMGVAYAILVETAISYLGLGIQPPMPSWGNMLQNAQQYLWMMPSLAVYPGVATMLTVLAYNFLGDGLRDALDPRSR
ncbi:MAG: ABC transporter permease [Firmicutes bacterium]|nr:ABC transporter permease [Bacillota bacterium]